MFEFLTGALGAVASLVGLFILGIILLVLALLSYRKSPPDEAMVVTGMGKKRFVVGNSAFVVPILQRVDRLYLGAVQALLSTEAPIPTKEAILIDVRAVANFQISIQPDLMERAARNYLNQPKDKMMQDVSEVLMGKMREVMGQMELTELMRNRDALNQKVFASAQEDMAALGLELITFNVQDFTDQEGVIKNMGADQSNEIRRDAQLARIQADQEVAIRQNELDLKEAELKKAADKARAEAEMVFQTITAERTRELNIAQQEAEIAAEEKRIELKEKAVAVKERELEAEVKKQAEADRYAAEQKAEAALFAEQKDAEAVRVKAEAKAAEIVAIGKAEGEAEEARGTGIAQAARKQIEAYNAMENANFLADRYIAVMPEIAQAVASPLASVDGITMYGSGNAAALVEETTQMASQVNAGLSDALGIDLKDVLSGIVTGTAAGRAAGAAQAQAEE